jgi:WD40 repeat protein
MARAFEHALPHRAPDFPVLGGGLPQNDFGDPFAAGEEANPARRKSLQVADQHLEGAAFSADGKRAAVRHIDKVELWELESGQHRVIEAENADGVALSPDGKWVVLGHGGARAELRVYDAGTGERKKTLTFGEFESLSRAPLAFSADGSILAAAHDRGVRLWRTAGWEELNTGIRERFFHADAVALSHDGSTLAVGPANRFGGGKSLLLWDTRQGKEKGRLDDRGITLEALAFDADGKRLASAGFDDLKVWDVTKDGPLWTAERDPFAATLAFSPDGRLLLSCGSPDVMFLSDAATGKRLAAVRRPWPQHGHLVAAQFTPDGGTLLTASEMGVVETWDVAALLKQRPRR